MNPTDLDSFLGVWRANPGPPLSSHTFTWEWDGVRLHGRWLVEASDSPMSRAVADAGLPGVIDIPVGEAWLEDGVILFRPSTQGFAMEFRLAGEHDAVVGMAVHKLEGGMWPELTRSVEGHRVKLHRERGTA